MTNYQIRLLKTLISASIRHSESIFLGDLRKIESARIDRDEAYKKLLETAEESKDGTWNSDDSH